MSPSILSRMETDATAAATNIIHPVSNSAPSSSSSAVTLDENLDFIASSSLSLMDLPAQLDECVKDTFLLGFSSAVIHCALRDLTTIRQAVLGVDHIKQLISEGYTPEMIETAIASKQELMDGFKSVEGDVRDLALGYTVVQVATQFDTASLSDDPSIDSIRLRRFQKMVLDMKSDPPKKSIEFEKIDYSSVFDFIEEERFNGLLVGDPAWSDVHHKKNHTLLGWRDQMKLSLNHLNNTFKQAADEVDWSASSKMDTDLLKAMPVPSLISLTLNNYEAAAVRLSAGPLSLGSNKTALVDAESLSRLGRDLRSDLLDHSKQLANEKFKAGRFAAAEILYGRALLAGSNDASVPINRAAALLKLNRFEEAQQSATVGLMQLDIAKRSLQTAQESGRESKGKQRYIPPSQRSRPMLTSQETFNELRWKAFIRRGRAHKEILTKMGGLSASDEQRNPEASPEDSSEEEEDDDDGKAEKRGDMLLAARSDFASALRIDPLNDIPRQEMASLTIDPLQRRPSHQDTGLALSSITQLDREKRRTTQESTVVNKPPKPRRSISD